MAKIAALEKTSSNCTDGCQTSFKYGNQPWNGCSGSSGDFTLSTTCRNGRNYKTYQECRETGMFLAWRQYEVWWYCSSLHAAGKLSGRSSRSPNSSDRDVARPYRRRRPLWVRTRRTNSEPMSFGYTQNVDIARYGRHVSKVPTAEILRRFTLCPRKGSGIGGRLPEVAYVGLPLLREFERRRDMGDEYAGCH